MTYDWGNTTSPLQTVTKSWADPFNMTEQDTMIGGVTSKITYVPGSFLPTETDEYDFGASTPTRKTLITYQSITAPGTIVNEPCKTIITEGANTSETDSYYDGGGTPCGADRGGSTTASLTTLPANHDETNYGPTAASSVARGNLTKLVRVLPGGTAPMTTFTYDETGQVVSQTDPCGNATCADMSGSTHTTAYSYTDSPAGGNNPYGQSNAYLTTITRPSTNGVAHTENYQYNYASGELSQSTDENSKTTTYSYTDPVLRLTDVYGPASSQNGNVQPHTHYKYSDNTYVLNQPPIPSTVTATGPTGIISVKVMDGLGKTVQTQLTTDPAGTDYVDTTYDGLGRVQSVSNPYRTTGDPTYGLTSYLYDPLNRKTTQCQPDNSTTSSTTCTPQSSYRSWSYPGNAITFTDENRNEWQRTVDGLGRMTQVLEPSGTSPNPTLTTKYSYDLFDNLVSVTQQGTGTEVARNRSFTYDLLSRLTCASNPESSSAGCPVTASSTHAGHDRVYL